MEDIWFFMTTVIICASIFVNNHRLREYLWTLEDRIKKLEDEKRGSP